MYERPCEGAESERRAFESTPVMASEADVLEPPSSPSTSAAHMRSSGVARRADFACRSGLHAEVSTAARAVMVMMAARFMVAPFT